MSWPDLLLTSCLQMQVPCCSSCWSRNWEGHSWAGKLQSLPFQNCEVFFSDDSHITASLATYRKQVAVGGVAYRLANKQNGSALDNLCIIKRNKTAEILQTKIILIQIRSFSLKTVWQCWYLSDCRSLPTWNLLVCSDQTPGSRDRGEREDRRSLFVLLVSLSCFPASVLQSN